MKRSEIKRTPFGQKRKAPRIPKSTKEEYRDVASAPTNKHIHNKWSQVVKAKVNNICELEGCGGMACGGALNAHHIFSSRHAATRFVPENGLSVCYVHHIHYIHHDTTKAAVDILRVIGQDRYDRMEALHMQTVHALANDRRKVFDELCSILKGLQA